MAVNRPGDEGQNDPRETEGVFARRPVTVFAGVAALAGLAMVGALILFGSSSEPRDTFLSCTVYENDSTLRLTLRGSFTAKEAEAGCGSSTEGLSSAASYWIVGTPSLPDEEPQLICALRDPEKPVTVLVEEVPSFLQRGESICGSLAGEGWTPPASAPRIGPGQREYLSALRAQEAVETEEQEVREREIAAEERRDEAVENCEKEARAAEEAEVDSIERETRERVQSAPESQEYGIEEEGWAQEEEAWERGEKAVERCEATTPGTVR